MTESTHPCSHCSQRIAELEEAIDKIHWYWSDWAETAEPLRGEFTRGLCREVLPRLELGERICTAGPGGERSMKPPITGSAK